jgi:hypothetical protein
VAEVLEEESVTQPHPSDAVPGQHPLQQEDGAGDRAREAQLPGQEVEDHRPDGGGQEQAQEVLGSGEPPPAGGELQGVGQGEPDGEKKGESGQESDVVLAGPAKLEAENEGHRIGQDGHQPEETERHQAPVPVPEPGGNGQERRNDAGQSHPVRALPVVVPLDRLDGDRPSAATLSCSGLRYRERSGGLESILALPLRDTS